jgi:lipopolysaccharide transport system ATP-binding protein
MKDTVIKVEGLGKRYRIVALQKDNRKRSLSGRLFSTFDYLSRMLREPTEEETLWAVRDISFEVKQGEVLGIIGQNGAGKSTLLKLASRITQPSTGRIELHGRVGSMLEVGTGFHPDLTGRENIYVNGALMGMTPVEINRKFDAIVEFSGVGKFLDTMVKYYSSGMYVRLAFAVAAHLEPEILIIDEVLAVGDAEFQKKCLGKMDEITKGGRTILFVSHNMIAIRSLCPNTMLLKNGSVSLYGQTDDVVETYLKAEDLNVLEQAWDDPESAPGNELVRFHRIWIRNVTEGNGNRLTRSSRLQVGVEYWNLTGAQIHITLHFLVDDNIIAFTSWSGETPDWQKYSKNQGLLQTTCYIPANFLNSGYYFINIRAVLNDNRVIYKFKNALTFNVLDDESREGGWLGKEPGVVTPTLDWETNIITTEKI